MWRMIVKVGFPFALFVALASVQAARASVDGDTGLLDLVKAGGVHRSESIKSFKGTVSVSIWTLGDDTAKESRVTKRITVASDMAKFRISCEGTAGSNEKYEAAFDGVKQTEWQKGGDFGRPVRISAGLTGITYSDFNLFINPHKVGNQSFDSYKDIKVIGREEFGGGDCVVLESLSSSAETYNVRTKLWVDVTKGFTLSKCESLATSKSTGEVLSRQVITNEMKDYAEDVWGPVKSTRASYDKDGTKVLEMTATYEPGFLFNVPVAGDELKLTLPSGIEVYDTTLEASYVVP